MAGLNFTPFTDVRTLWPNVAAVNAFFGSITVSIGANDLPEPTTETLGGVMWLELGAAFNAPAVVSTYETITVSDGGVVTSADVPTKAAWLLLVAQVSYLKNYCANLDAQLRAKGYVDV